LISQNPTRGFDVLAYGLKILGPLLGIMIRRLVQENSLHTDTCVLISRGPASIGLDICVDLA
jgi:hypothetical protein